MTARHTKESFLKNMDRSGGKRACWIWEKMVTKKGYGTVTYHQKHMRAHRVAYILFRGEIPEGMLVCHKCDNPSCCNPSHLFLGTNADNMKDRDRKKRQCRGEARSAVARKHSPRGSRHHKAVINEDQVREIRVMHSKGIPRKKIAEHIGVRINVIHRVVTRRFWRHVE